MGLLGLSPEDEYALAGLLFQMPDKYGRAPMAPLGQYLMGTPERKRQAALQEAQQKHMAEQTKALETQNQGMQDINLALQNRESIRQAGLLSPDATPEGLAALKAATETQNQGLLGGAAMSGDANLLKFAQQNAGMSPIDETWYGSPQPISTPEGVKMAITSNLGNRKFLDYGENASPMLSGSWLDTGLAKEWAPNKNVIGSGISSNYATGLPKSFTKTVTPENQPETARQIAAAKEQGQEIGKQTSVIAGKQDALDSVMAAKDLLNKGIYSGFYGPLQKGFTKAVPFMDKTKASRTEEFTSYIGETVIPRLKEFGGNDSNEELRYLQRVMGGDITLEPETLNNVLSNVEKKIQRGIERYKQTGGAPNMLQSSTYQPKKTEMKQGKIMTAADLAETAKVSGRSIQDVVKAAKAKGYQVEGY